MLRKREKNVNDSKGGNKIPQVLPSFILSFSVKNINLINLEVREKWENRERKFTEIAPRKKGELLWLSKYRGLSHYIKLCASKKNLVSTSSGCKINVAHLTRSHLPVASAIQNITESWKISKTELSTVKRTVTLPSTKIYVLDS